MIGLILILGSSFFREISTTLGKEEMSEHKESIYYYSFLSLFASFVIFLAMFFVRPESFVFSYASLPSFSLRFVLEVLLLVFGALSIERSDRTTASFLRILTIPFISAAAVIFQLSKMSYMNIFGFFIIVATMGILFYKEILSRSYASYGLISALLASFTIGLFKYDVTNYNSVLGEQITMTALLLVILAVIIKVKTKEDMFSLFKKRLIFTQTATSGIGGVLSSFAYALLSPVVGVAASRVSEIGFAVLSGHKFFNEHDATKKALFILPIATGIILLLI